MTLIEKNLLERFKKKKWKKKKKERKQKQKKQQKTNQTEFRNGQWNCFKSWTDKKDIIIIKWAFILFLPSKFEREADLVSLKSDVSDLDIGKFSFWFM